MTLKEYIKLYKDYDKEIDKLAAVFPQAFESNLVEQTWAVFDKLLDYVVKENNLNIDDVVWFIYDNECGDNGYKLNGIPINSLEDFMIYETGIRIKLKNGKNIAFIINESEEKNTINVSYIPDDLTEKDLDKLDKLIVTALTDFVEEVL